MYICKNFLTQKEYNRRVKLSLRRKLSRARARSLHIVAATTIVMQPACRLSILDQLITVIK